MKKIKLIKLYPGSPSLGATLTQKVDIDNSDTNNFYWEGSWFNPNYYPEFWEEVVELDYEIVGMKTLTGDILEYEDGVCVKRSNSIYPSKTNKLQDCLLGNRCTIYSVKRLSDGEVFTIGDRISVSDIGISDTITEIVLADSVKWTSKVVTKKIFLGCENDHQYILSSVNKPVPLDYEILSYAKKDNPKCHTMKRRGGERHNEFWNIRVVKRLSDGEVFAIGNKVQFMDTKSVNGFITKFEIIGDRILVTYGNQTSNLDSLVLVKLSIFRTEDGVDVFDGDRVWYVRKDLTYNNSFIISNNCFVVGENLYFSKKQLMKEYIKLNTRCLSFNDVLSHSLSELERLYNCRTI